MPDPERYLFRGPSIKVDRMIIDQEIWLDDHKLARWLRAEIEADRARRKHRRFYIPDRVWQPILAAFGYRCAYCGTTGPLERDHRMPVSRGGSDDPSNLVPACKPCNVRKGAKHPDDWPLLIEPSA